jgi:hypothetical protein
MLILIKRHFKLGGMLHQKGQSLHLLSKEKGAEVFSKELIIFLKTASTLMLRMQVKWRD